MFLGPYEIRVAMQERWMVSVTVSTRERTASGSFPVAFLDGKGRLLFAPTITLRDQDGIRRGSATVRGSYRWQEVKSVAGPASNAAVQRQDMRVVPLRWGEPVAVNIVDSSKDDRSSVGAKEPQKSPTRAFQLKADRNNDGTAKLTVDIVSIDGPHEFYLDVAGAILGRSGAVLASGHVSTDLRVEYRPVERRIEIPLGQLDRSEAPAFVAIGITPGNVTSAPLGSRWGMILDTTAAFDVATLLAAPDEESRRTGLIALASLRTGRAILSEFISDWFDEPVAGKGSNQRQKLLQPLADSFVRIAREPGSSDVRVNAARYLAYSEAKGAAEELRTLAADSDPRVREAAAIGLTFLGQADYLEVLRSIVNRTIRENEDEPRPELVSFHDQDALTALARSARIPPWTFWARG